MIFDSHAHYDDKQFNGDRDIIIKSLQGAGVSFVINAGASMRSSKKSIELADKYDFIYASVGIHPHSAKDMIASDIDTLREYSKHKKVVAIGEVGLDYHYDFSPRDVQADCFIKQLALAKELDMPVIIHSREAAQAVFDIIKDSGVNKGVIHSYSGSSEMALDYIEIGYHIGIGGVLTFRNAEKLVRVVSEIPMDRILIETDAPYLAPAPHRGERNYSEYLCYVVKRIAEIKGVPEDEVERVTEGNAKGLFFGVDKSVPVVAKGV